MIAQQQVDLFQNLSNFCKWCRSIWGAMRYGPHDAMFKKYKKKNNKGTFGEFIKPSKCQMGGDFIS
jgi:hypothetical protein